MDEEQTIVIGFVVIAAAAIMALIVANYLSKTL